MKLYMGNNHTTFTVIAKKLMEGYIVDTSIGFPPSNAHQIWCRKRVNEVVQKMGGKEVFMIFPSPNNPEHALFMIDINSNREAAIFLKKNG